MEPKTECEICNLNKYRYCCPKCNIVYCSVTCYKNPKHQQCSELFYKDLVHEELAFQAANKSPKEMYEMLQRVQNIESPEFGFEESIDENLDEDLDSDDQEDIDLATRLDGIDINNTTEIWKRLTNEEKYEFEKMIENGDIIDLLPNITPWWEIKSISKLIEDLESSKEVELKNPPLIENIAPFASLLTKEPSSCLSNNLNNILASYVCTCRFFANEHHTSSLEATNYMILLSNALKANSNFDTIEQAIKSVIFESTSESIPIATDEYLKIFNDVQNILEGPDSKHRTNLYTLSALSDIHKLFKEAKKFKFSKIQNLSATKDFNSKFSDFEVNKFDENLTKLKLNQLIKKIEFYISYINAKYI